MIKKLYIPFFIYTVLMVQSGCETSSIEPDLEDLGYGFYPLECGIYREYKIQRIVFTSVNDPDTSNYYLRELVIDSILNVEEKYTYILARYTKDSLHKDWKPDSLWKAEKNSKFVRITENNIPYIKLVFPVGEGITWDGNIYNSGEEKVYYMENVNMPFQSSDTLFSETVKVVHDNIPDPIVRFVLKYEVFAKNSGMVYKEYVDLSYDTSDEWIGQEKIDYGIMFKQEIIGYGKDY